MRFILHIWRQPGPDQPGKMVRYEVDNISPDMSFLEMLDQLNEELTARGEEPVAFEHDCREGICGSCGFLINGVPHGPLRKTTVCQLHMRHFKDGQEIYIEPFRARPFRVIKDLIVDRSSLDRIIAAGGYISVHTGSAPEANTIPVPKQVAELAMDAASCIGCGACVAACPNASASLFVGAKIRHLNLLPHGQPERYRRAIRMVEAMMLEHFGACTNTGECEAVCPKGIKLEVIAHMHRDFVKACLTYRE